MRFARQALGMPFVSTDFLWYRSGTRDTTSDWFSRYATNHQDRRCHSFSWAGVVAPSFASRPATAYAREPKKGLCWRIHPAECGENSECLGPHERAVWQIGSQRFGCRARGA
jgi:hypothetical protein